jgi:crossover junction endodeoxyribonuclease RuvC
MGDSSPSPTLRVLGVDPGSRITGWGVLEGSSRRTWLVAGDVIRLAAGLPLAERLFHLQREIERVVESQAPGIVAVESPYHGASARSALVLAHARGAILAALGRTGVPVAEYAPATVKNAVTGNGRADKDQVRRMLAHWLGAAVVTRPHDLTDALAVALCHVASCRHATAVAHGRSRAR